MTSSVRLITPDPYIQFKLDATDHFIIRPFARDTLDFEFWRHATLKHCFRLTLEDLRDLRVLGERLITDRLHRIDRERYGASLVVWSP